MYKVIEYCNEQGEVGFYGIASKLLWWWIPCGMVGYFNKKDAKDVCSKLNGGYRLSNS